jgi:hypothetical protein
MKTGHFLFINTINPFYPSFAILNSEYKSVCVKPFVEKQENLVSILRQCFLKHKIKNDSVREVLVMRGQGSFTALRAGVVLANMFGFLKGTPIRSINPEYGKTIENLIKKDSWGRRKSRQSFVAKAYYGGPPRIIIK